MSKKMVRRIVLFIFLLEKTFSFVVFIKEQIYGYSVNVLIMTKVLLVPEALAEGY